MFFARISAVMAHREKVDNEPALYSFGKLASIELVVIEAFSSSGMTFKLRLDFPDGYPYTAPTVKFTSPCYHPNVDQVRDSCTNIA